MGKSDKEKTSLLSNFIKNVNQVNNGYVDFAIRKGFPQVLKGKYSLAIIVVVLVFTISFLFTETVTNSNIPTYVVKKDLFLISITESGEIKAKKSISISAPRVRSPLKIV